MPTLEKPTHISVDLEIDEAQGKTPEELTKEVRQAYYMKQYLDDESGVSLGKFAELMGMGYEEARDWLNAQGVVAPKKLPPELREKARKTYHKMSQELKRG